MYWSKIWTFFEKRIDVILKRQKSFKHIGRIVVGEQNWVIAGHIAGVRLGWGQMRASE
jgi:hypothetical protein